MQQQTRARSLISACTVMNTEPTKDSVDVKQLPIWQKAQAEESATHTRFYWNIFIIGMNILKGEKCVMEAEIGTTWDPCTLGLRSIYHKVTSPF